MVAPTLTSEQYQYEDTGVLLNGTSTLPFIDIKSVQGLDQAPIRGNVTSREGTHGGYVDATFEDPRTVILEGDAYASPTALETYLDSLKANYAPSRLVRPFYIGTDAGMRMLFAKSMGARYPKDLQRRLGIIPVQIQVNAPDPRLFEITAVTQSLPGTLTLTGNRDTHGIITINGARTNPTITIGSTTFAFAYTLPLGQNIQIDLYNHTVLLNTNTNLRGSMTLTGLWPTLNPGANVFTVGGTGAGAISITARSAWR